MGVTDPPAIPAFQRPFLRALAMPRQSIYTIGDSWTYVAGETVTNVSRTSRSFIDWALAFLGYRLRKVGQAGFAGQTLAQIKVSGWATALAANPGFMLIEGGTNDILRGHQNALSSAATLAGITDTWQDMAEDCIDRGIIPVILNIAPRGDTIGAAYHLVRAEANDWLAAYAAATPGVVAVDINRRVRVLSNATTSFWDNYYSVDHVHPAAPGAARIGRAIAEAIAPLVTGTHPLKHHYDERNLIGVGFQNTAPQQSFWTSVVIAGAAPTYTQVQRADRAGYWQQVVAPTGASSYLNHQELLVDRGLVIGDRVQASVEMESDDDWEISGVSLHPVNQFRLDIRPLNAAGAIMAEIVSWGFIEGEQFGYNPRSAVLQTPVLTLPALAARIQVNLVFVGGGTIRWSYPTVVKVP